MILFPHEIAVGDVYLSPFLIVILLAFFVASITTLIINKLKLTQFIFHPPLAFIAIMTLYVLLIDKFLIQI